MELAGLETLKQKLVEAKDFMPVWDYFMTHFGEQPDFMKLGDNVRVPFLEGALQEAAHGVFGATAAVKDLFLVRLAEHRFIHGALTVQGKFANVFYFEDVGVGLLTVVVSMAGDNRLIRFTAQTLGGGELARQ